MELCTGLGYVVDEACPEIDARALRDAQRMIVSSSTRMVLEMRAGFFGREPKADDVEGFTQPSGSHSPRGGPST